MGIKGLVIAAAGSGSGKTTVSLGLMAALRRRGWRVAPFKVGPDFIDPGHHARAAGTPSRNLDGWMLPQETNRNIFRQAARSADVAVVEGVMGLFDGFDGRSEEGSTAQMAKWLGLPVLLVVDARSMARSAAALVQGFERFDPQLRFAGVLFNRVGSPRHLEYLRQALEGQVAMDFLGGLPREDALAIPERHLGLHTAEDHPLGPDRLARLASLVEDHVDLERLVRALPEVRGDNGGECPPDPGFAQPPRVRLGVARDAAFCFYYPDNLDLLARAGADLVTFSPLNDTDLPPGLAGLYLGGGYPELHARRLAQNSGMRAAIGRAGRAGMPIYAECGGLMYLCRELDPGEGARWPMCGRFPFGVRMLARRRALGYREVRLTSGTLLGPAGACLRGHEFHYSEIAESAAGVDTVYRIAPRRGDSGGTPEGYRVGNTVGSYVHLHFGSFPAAATHLVEACRRWRDSAAGAPQAGSGPEARTGA
jgi:cobyrinic acid a,c-diamide synthase